LTGSDEQGRRENSAQILPNFEKAATMVALHDKERCFLELAATCCSVAHFKTTRGHLVGSSRMSAGATHRITAEKTVRNGSEVGLGRHQSAICKFLPLNCGTWEKGCEERGSRGRY